MVDIAALAEFSRNNCIAICSGLVPANLLTTLTTLILVVLNRPRNQLRFSVIIAVNLALILALHVVSWWVIGVVQAPTFILLALSTVCLALNGWAIVQKRGWVALISHQPKWLKLIHE
ncbi:conserved hypothetical protein [Rippkaea orientalis PCC 8801]|uniref:Uncharacterized protein n=1 Tax=Rippkaea orientalis (strain PCC 8801 / RF-1) TaxID=41431 RepID=B7JZC8_RIPO1|nr:hypothetical protein [Rippkaea orientalis]ACK67339.1 conserved hypothetical protein [Rippkaea orientalis PCC 8801]